MPDYVTDASIESVATTPEAMDSACCTAAGTKIYVFGGRIQSTKCRASAYRFDTDTQSIDSDVSMSDRYAGGAYGMTCAYVGENVYLFGGRYLSSSEYGSYTYSTKILYFNTYDNGFRTMTAVLPTALHYMGCAAVGTKIYLFGGIGNAYSSAIYCFDTATRKIETLSVSLPTALYSPGCVAIGTKIYLFGGVSDGNKRTTSILCFDTKTHTIDTLSASLPIALSNMACAAIGTTIYLFGGYAVYPDGSEPSGFSNKIISFDAKTGEVKLLSLTLPVAGESICGAFDGSGIYLFGGLTTGSTRLNSVLYFKPSSENPDDDTHDTISMSDYVIIPIADYEDACNKIRERTGKADLIKSEDLASEIASIPTGGAEDMLEPYIKKTITNANLPNVTSVSGFSGCTKLRTVNMPNVTSIGSSAFKGCTSLALTELPSGVTSIGDSAFESCRSLKLTELPSGVTGMLSKKAFYGCSNLALTHLPSGVTGIAVETFCNCTSLALTELPSGLTTISSKAFYGITNLPLIELSSSLTSIGSEAFRNCTNLALTALPSGLTSIGDYAFYECIALALTELPTGLTKISVWTFYRCKNLALTSLPDGITSIGKGAFYSCTSLALTELPSGLTTIGDDGFNNCVKLAVTEIPSGVSTIGLRAFSNCELLTSVIFKGTPSSISSSAFTSCTDLRAISVPWSSDAVSGAPWGATNATIYYDTVIGDEIQFTVGPYNDVYTAREGMSWGHFVYSEYNTDGKFSVSSNGSIIRSGIYVDSTPTDTGQYVNKTDRIISGNHYFAGYPA